MKREYNYDALRVFAIFLVMVIHVCAMQWDTLPIDSMNWKVLSTFDSFARSSVPLFIMLSGAFLLDPKKEITIKRLFSKYILRLVVVIMVWGVAYQFMMAVVNHEVINITEIVSMLKNNIVSFGHTRLWFVYILLGLYLLLPMYRSIVSGSRSYVLYFIILAFTTTFIISFFSTFPLFTGIASLLQNMGATSFVGFSGYFVLGHVLRTSRLTSKVRYVLYALGIFGFLVTLLGTLLYSNHMGVASEAFYNYLSPNIVLLSVAIFVFGKHVTIHSERIKQILRIVEPTIFGVYLFHNLINQVFISLQIFPTKFFTVLSIPLIAILWFAISFMAIFVARKVVLIRKYLT